MKSDINASLADDAFLFKVVVYILMGNPDENTSIATLRVAGDEYCTSFRSLL